MAWILSEFLNQDDLSRTVLKESGSVAGSRYELFWDFLPLEVETGKLYRNVGR